ncbi:regulatory protein, tetR family [Chryseobacterium taichungense]|uniref:Regulatory protein, tetR family n=1 Tax=Chryseobacterium taichungense TaxID=295069 RepID=A0A1H7YKK4_9FLAO|nr:TetR/AcrR family transcriptional regulator [Chryseobacterium taichungense]SEM45659.1 regulatory protein, tetR family [Chryseobacterium taichungense]
MSTKEHILKRAEELFFRKGYHSTTIRDIATEASVNCSMINYYFLSKENLYVSIFGQLHACLEAIPVIAENGHSFSDGVKTFIDQTINVAYLHPKLVYLFMIEQLQASTMKIGDIVNSIQKKHFEYFCSLFKSYNKNNTSIPVSRLETTYFAIFGLVKEFVRVEKINSEAGKNKGRKFELKKLKDYTEKIISLNQL